LAGVSKVRGPRGRKSPSGVQGRSPGRGSGDEVPQKLNEKWVLILIENNCKIGEEKRQKQRYIKKKPQDKNIMACPIP